MPGRATGIAALSYIHTSFIDELNRGRQSASPPSHSLHCSEPDSLLLTTPSLIFTFFYTPFHLCSLNLSLLPLGCWLNTGQNPYAWANAIFIVQNGSASLAFASQSGHANICTLLIEVKADVNAESKVLLSGNYVVFALILSDCVKCSVLHSCKNDELLEISHGLSHVHFLLMLFIFITLSLVLHHFRLSTISILHPP